jgi:hypothetical protein
MAGMKGQASPDFAMSAMIFSIAVLFVFFHIARTYYTRTWEISRIEKIAAAQNLVLFLAGESGNWSGNPFQSESIGFGGDTFNETRLNYFFGMPYQTAQAKLGVSQDFLAEVWKLPDIGIISDISDFYINETVEVNFETSENSTLYAVLVGTAGTTGVSLVNETAGTYHNFEWDLDTGVYNLQVLAVSGGKYGTFGTTFRVIS